MKFENKVAYITGGASGLGKETAELLAKEGAKVMIADFSDAGQEVADAIGGAFVKVDVTNDDQVRESIEKTVEEFGKLDIVVASAGIGGDNSNIMDCAIENWNKVNAVDYTGVVLVNKYAVQQMLKQGTGGSIINLASMYGLVGIPTNVAYSASKGAVVNFSRAAGTTFADQGIRINAVCPGVIQTPIIPEILLDDMGRLHPTNRMGKTEEVAALIAFLASDEAAFVSGSAYAIDGGYTAV